MYRFIFSILSWVEKSADIELGKPEMIVVSHEAFALINLLDKCYQNDKKDVELNDGIYGFQIRQKKRIFFQYSMSTLIMLIKIFS